MKTYLDCFPCIVRQALESARMATNNEILQREILNSVFKELPKIPQTVTPPEIAVTVHRIIKKVSGNKDPYKKVKEKFNKKALQLYSDLKQRINKSDNHLLTAAKLAIAGNIIDFGVGGSNFDLNQNIKEVLSSNLAIDHFNKFKDDILSSSSVLYIGDNAGEIVFDRILIEEIKKCSEADIFFVVRGEPILNDATIEDAKFVGIDKVAKVISDGYDAPAILLSNSSKELKKAFDSADMVIAKGQGNYETLNEVKGNIYFLLKAKCLVLAKDIKSNLGDNILKCNIE